MSLPESSVLLLRRIQRMTAWIAKEIEIALNPIYDMTPDAVDRIKKLIDMASDLCLPINGQEDVIVLHTLRTNDRVIAKQVKPVYRRVGEEKEGDEKICLGIAPVFLAKSTVEADDEMLAESYLENYTLVYPGRAIW
ncbi:hypothetical protein [Parasitella parasitica]|uniref:Uncharacterized protein n=1 Tax=Parasitella parasitica TaxID=35722 RepID=A0A0B7MZD2_9FUNG|nr:hypothetical protein [Parasitella parasitica]